LAAKGYIQVRNDWKNVEMTGYFKINSFTKPNQNGPPHIELVACGGRSTHDVGTIDDYQDSVKQLLIIQIHI